MIREKAIVAGVGVMVSQLLADFGEIGLHILPIDVGDGRCSEIGLAVIQTRQIPWLEVRPIR